MSVPAFNMAQWLGGAVEARLRSRSTGNVEVVVYDNCSTDETQKVLAGLRCPALRSVRGGTHVNVASSSNAAVPARDGTLGDSYSTLDDELLPQSTRTDAVGRAR